MAGRNLKAVPAASSGSAMLTLDQYQDVLDKVAQARSILGLMATACGPETGQHNYEVQRSAEVTAQIVSDIERIVCGAEVRHG